MKDFIITERTPATLAESMLIVIACKHRPKYTNAPLLIDSLHNRPNKERRLEILIAKLNRLP